MRKRIPIAVIAVACLALAGSTLAAGFSIPRNACKLRFAVAAGPQTFGCRIASPEIHVYVNHRELLVANMLNRSATAAVYYGRQSAVRVSQHGDTYQINAVSLIPGATVGVRLVRPRPPAPLDGG